MGRIFILLCTVALLLGGGPGCSAPFRAVSPDLSGGPRASSKSNRSNPIRQAAGEAPVRGSSKRAESTAEDANARIQLTAAERPAKSGETGSAAHDAATLRMIDDELKDAGPEEREQLLADLRGLQPAMVRQILTIRRMVREMGQEVPGHARSSGLPDTLAGAGSPSPSQAGTAVQPAGGAPPPAAAQPGYAPARTDAGLGSVDPWGDRRSAGSSSAHNWGDGRKSFDGSAPEPDPLAQPPVSSREWGMSASPEARPPEDAARPNQPTSYGHSMRYGPSSVSPAAAGPPAPGVMPVSAGSPPLGQNAAHSPSPFQATAHGTPAGLRPNPGSPPTESGRASVVPNSGDDVDVGLATYSSPAIGGTATAADGGPLESAAHPDWNPDLERLVARVEADVAQMRLGERPTELEQRSYIENHVYLRMLYLIAGRQERALTAIPGIHAADQEFWQQTLWAVANYFDADAIPDAGDRASQTVAQLRSAIQRLQENARLELRNVTFCHKIASYGNYERFDRDEFSPGQPVLVYAEVANFKSEPAVDGQFRTMLKSTVEIHKAGHGGDLVERMAFPATEDLCRNYRRDYFHSYEFAIPQRISLGPHVMKLIVEDQLSRKVATYTLNFIVK